MDNISLKRTYIQTKMRKSEFFLVAGSCLLLLVICCFLSTYQVFSYISIGIALVFLYAIYRYKPGLFIKYLAFVFAYAAAALGVIIIEFNSINIVELRTDSSFEGSLPLLLLSYSVLMSVFAVFDDTLTINDFKKEVLHQSTKYPKYMLYLTYITIMIYTAFFLRVITKPAFLLKVNRFIYARDYMFETSGIWGILSNQLLLLIFFPIMSIIKGHKKEGIIGVALYVLYNLWTGSKFGPFFSILCVFLILMYPQIAIKKNKTIRKIIFSALSVLLIIVFLAVEIESILGGTINNYALFRFSGQGEMWWGTYKAFKETVHFSEISDEIVGLFHGESSIAANVGSNYGIYKLMYLLAPRSVIDIKLGSGSRYTESGFACAYYYLGTFGCFLFAVLIGVVITKILNEVIRMIQEERYLRAIVLLRFFMLIRETQSMFVFYEFIDLLSIISYILLLYTHTKKISIKTNNVSIAVF